MDVEEIRARLRERGLNQSRLAEHLGLRPNQISLTLAGKRRFTVAEMDKVRELLGDAPAPEMPAARPIPIIGQVAAGNWREAVQRPVGSMPSPDPSMPARAFALRVKGDSMDQLVEDGGTIIVDPEDKALFPGRFYVVLNAEGETTFKQFKIDPARLAPCSTNPEHKDIVIGDGTFQMVGRIIWRASRM
ncbi:LexA family transcriptional regulator [Sphingosinicella sp. BN140058]|uniref:LexA family protein n=1 Tax=Sphingosinicella sp. BN140058 TaxID=1892855 RepID=UPI0013EC830C|nr:S24 family peptidase [Sphingosinicella sp. BN140058]